VWDGFLLEVGALRRERDVYVWPESESQTFTRSTEYAGRALVGWSWLIHQRAFIAIAAGLSVGYESGNDTTIPASAATLVDEEWRLLILVVAMAGSLARPRRRSVWDAETAPPADCGVDVTLPWVASSSRTMLGADSSGPL
jgi:hypothetical protein